jgi:signal transduction histidine kinase
VIESVVRHARSIAWVSVGLAAALTLSYPVLFFLNGYSGLGMLGGSPLSELVHLSTVVAGGLIVTRHPKNAIGWMLIFIGLSGLLNASAQDYSVLANIVHHKTLVGGTFAAWLGSWLFLPGIALLVTLVLLLFPDGHLPSRRWRPVAWLSTATVVVATVGLAVGAIPKSPDFAVDSGGVITISTRLADTHVLGIFAFLMGLVCVAALVVRFRRSRGQERQQLKWFTYGGVLFASGIIVTTATVVGPGPNHNSVPAWAGTYLELTTVAIPVAIAIAVLKYRLYDIDVVISRTLVYGSLAAFITAVYVGIVVGVGTLIGSGGQPNLVLSIIATAIVAVAFQPVRERLQKVANRLVYGKRATPYEVLSQFSEHVAESYAADDVLPRMARVLAEGTGAERAQVWLRGGDVLRATAAWPEGGGIEANPPIALRGQLLPTIPDVDRVVPVRHQGVLLGALTVSKRQGESLTPVEEKLLDDLASQAGLVLKNVGLTAELLQRLEDLRASRQRLVAAQDGERRRLERNLHDGAQQNLVAIKVKLGLAEMFADKDPARARATLAELKADTDEALDTLRDLARGIYPPLLADQGLAAALDSQARKATLRVEVQADGIGRYPEDVEAAVYFCCLEALQNVQKYAAAKTAVVTLGSSGDALTFEVTDDGHGFDAVSVKRGAGLTNMTDRIDALGGSIEVSSTPGRGTRIHGSLPVAVASVTPLVGGLRVAT